VLLDVCSMFATLLAQCKKKVVAEGA